MSLLSTRQIQLLAAIADTGQLQQAADKLKISQPAASRMLADMEARVGFELFTRTPKGMQVSTMGQDIIPRAAHLHQEIQRLDEDITDLRHGYSGRIRIGAVTGAALALVLPAIRIFKQEFPRVELSVDVSPSKRLLRQLQDGQLDFVLARFLPEFERSEFIIEDGLSERVHVVARNGHPIASKTPLHAADLLNYEWIIQEHQSPIRETIWDYFNKELGVLPQNIVTSSSSLFTLGYLVESDALTAFSEEVISLLTHTSMQAELEIVHTKTPLVVPHYQLIQKRHRHLDTNASRIINRIKHRLNAIKSEGE